jgi:cyclopropane-fatty-acyl-phospholipid synthase
MRLGFFNQLARRMVRGTLPFLDDSQLEQTGQLIFTDQSSGLRATVVVEQPALFRKLICGGSMGAAAAYISGDWRCDDLTALIRVFIRNADTADKLDGRLTRLTSWGQRLYHRWRPNNQRGSRRNIAAHYDLGNDFFRLWLDESLAYSSGIFLRPGAELAEASREKFDRLCRKLELEASDHLLEIGSGWGGFALHAAREYDCQVTTTTISQEQFRANQRLFQQHQLGQRVRQLDQDYRELTGAYDKLISIEMIEAVGSRYYEQFFRQCSALLRPNGSLALQAIVMPERRYAAYQNSVDFIQHYIFPGGCLPSLSALLEAAGRGSDLRLVHVEDFAPHYAETLRRWKTAFFAQREEVQALGYSAEFVRMWEYYLCYCEALFEERHVSLLQLVFDKPECRRDPLRLSTQAAQSDLSAMSAREVDSLGTRN